MLTFCPVLQVLAVVFSLLSWYDVNMRNVMGKSRRICNIVAGGKSVLSACRRVKVNRATFYRWMNARPAVAMMYQAACRARLDTVIDQLAWVQQEIARMRATVPAERPRDGVYFGELLRAIRNLNTPSHVLENMHSRTSRRCYQRQRREMWQNTEYLREWRDELRLEYARLLGRLERCVTKTGENVHKC